MLQFWIKIQSFQPQFSRKLATLQVFPFSKFPFRSLPISACHWPWTDGLSSRGVFTPLELCCNCNFYVIFQAPKKFLLSKTLLWYWIWIFPWIMYEYLVTSFFFPLEFLNSTEDCNFHFLFWKFQRQSDSLIKWQTKILMFLSNCGW